MENQLQQLLQISAKLFELLKEQPKEVSKEEYIENINILLDKRGELMQQIISIGFQYNPTNKIHQTLYELDLGIKKRLALVLQGIKTDMKELQTTKKYEQQYSNPYGHVQSMDGMYYDKKK